ncbi:universal stress protein UspA (plasmid) [Halostagnicola larsenii XH-48]|uniref:Universal stress protein UspA n=1 Tax=Halostagnicola larsenii XH-48 TaxID=797299 RepID=W0JVU6_9EURY|nr:universal stress protein [Halostagnicola larsenii]AHG01355.1 universal stress protein UspA [Halostagnicola larsenii XH-48]
MDHALVVIDDTDDHRSLLAEAGQLAHDTGAKLTVLSWITPDQTDETAKNLEVIEQIEGTSYSDPGSAATAKQFARQFATDVFESFDDPIEFDADGIVTEDDDRADEIIAAAERLECDHVFIVGRRRSPTGKALFGDVAQRILLNFDGTVTLRMT